MDINVDEMSIDGDQGDASDDNRNRYSIIRRFGHKKE